MNQYEPHNAPDPMRRDFKIAVGTVIVVAGLLALASWASASTFGDRAMQHGGDGVLRPMAGVSVKIRRPGNATVLASTTTGSDGTWTISTLTESGLYAVDINGTIQTRLIALARNSTTLCFEGCCSTTQSGTPEGNLQGISLCHFSRNSANGDRYRFTGTPGATTGWALEICGP